MTERREQTYTMSDQMIWDTYYRDVVGPGVMTNQQLDDAYAAYDATAKERREEPPQPSTGRRKGEKA